jgi:hypothetical protein
MTEGRTRYSLELRSDSGADTVALELFSNEEAGSAWLEEGAVQTVFDDVTYGVFLRLTDENELRYLVEVDTTVAGAVTRETDLSDNTRAMRDIRLFYSHSMFSHVMGLTYVTVTVRYERDEKTFYTRPISVCHRASAETENLNRMTGFVLDEGRWLFENDGAAEDFSRRGKDSQLARFFNERLEAVRRVIQVYSYNAHFFASNSRARLVQKGAVENFEKLTNLTYDTISFIAQHPEELLPTHTNSGIRHGSKSFLPKRTLVVRNDFDRDIYENRIVVSFLRTIGAALDASLKEAAALEEKIPALVNAPENWVNTSEIVVRQAEDILSDIRRRTLDAQKEVRHLAQKFREFLPVTEVAVSRVPRPSPLFASVTQYRQIYDVIKIWFEEEKRSMPDNYFIVDFSRSSNVYEYYCLLRIFACLEEAGWIMTEKSRLPWKNPYQSVADDVSEERCYNFFEFARGASLLSLYFEPLVSSRAENNFGLGLVRNSTAKLVRVDEDLKLRKDRSNPLFYSPDFVLRKTEGGKSKYLILDAKYSAKSTVIESELLDLVFRYLLSVSPVAEEDEIWGLSALCGKLKKEDDALSDSPLWDLRAGFAPCLNKDRVRVFEVNETERTTDLKEALTVFSES